MDICPKQLIRENSIDNIDQNIKKTMLSKKRTMAEEDDENIITKIRKLEIRNIISKSPVFESNGSNMGSSIHCKYNEDVNDNCSITSNGEGCFARYRMKSTHSNKRKISEENDELNYKKKISKYIHDFKKDRYSPSCIFNGRKRKIENVDETDCELIASINTTLKKMKIEDDSISEHLKCINSDNGYKTLMEICNKIFLSRLFISSLISIASENIGIIHIISNQNVLTSKNKYIL